MAEDFKHTIKFKADTDFQKSMDEQQRRLKDLNDNRGTKMLMMHVGIVALGQCDRSTIQVYIDRYEALDEDSKDGRRPLTSNMQVKGNMVNYLKLVGMDVAYNARMPDNFTLRALVHAAMFAFHDVDDQGIVDYIEQVKIWLKLPMEEVVPQRR